ncbi:MAG: ATP-binding cassette domain-containing protein [Nitrospinaceae bacterium]|nr:ATP-binding cassette domain-containing protein [Nitrospinaceae bacterium]
MKPVNSLLKVCGVSFSRDGKFIFKNISFELFAGEILILLGPSGCGKTSLLRCLNRLESVAEGEMFLQGVPISRITSPDLRRRVGMVFQTSADLLGTVEESISVGPSLNQQKISAHAVTSLMEKVGLDTSLRNRKVSGLSTGEHQRLSLAQVLANEPQVLMLDEPTSGLDPTAVLTVENLVQKLNASLKTGILLVTHDINQAVRFNSRTLVLANGEILADGNIQELINSSQNLQLQKFFQGQF